MRTDTFREVLDMAADGDPGAQEELKGLARQGVLDEHVARLQALENAEWAELLEEAVPDSATNLARAMHEMAGRGEPTAPVSMAAPAGAGQGRPPGNGLGLTPAEFARAQAVLVERQRVEDPAGWAARTRAGIEAAQLAGWKAWRAGQDAAEAAAVSSDPDVSLPAWEFAAKYGIG
jgi:hypothetical protein